MSLGRTICAFCVGVTVWVTPMPIAHATKGIPGAPKIINPFLDWQLRDEDLSRLSRWDVVILDADQQTRSPERIRKLRELNPAIKILAYVPSEEIAQARFTESGDYPFGRLASRIQDDWYVRDASGNKSYFWSGSFLLNVTDKGPLTPGTKRWNEFLPAFIHDDVLSSGLWDGIFLDNTFDAISYYSKLPVDLDRNGVADTKEDQDRAWRAGMTKILRKIRELNPSAIIIGNGGHAYADQMNGAFFEHFPSWNWAVNWKEFRQSVAKNPPPSYTALNVNTDNQERPADYRLMRYGLANALVGGGYFSFDKGDYNHNTMWWYDEYEVPIGAARAEPRALVGGKGAAIVPAVWARDFQNGIVLLNSTDVSKRVSLPGVFEKIRGTQDPATNDGSILTSVDVAAYDGLILLRRSEPEEIRGSAFENGSFVRMYDAQGRQPQNGFFAQRSDASSGALVLSVDVNGDAVDDIISAARGAVLIRTANGRTSVVFSPFGAAFRDGISVAIGRLDVRGDTQIVTARERGGPPEVRIFSLSGKLMAHWEAYRSGFSGGVRVAAGDLDGDGKREIVTGAGPGGGPHVRIWKTDGAVWGGSFFAFDPSESGGIQIAVGDVDGDAKDEIVVASGQGAKPRVRIFDFKGTLKREIPLGTQPLAGGLRVAVSDANGDGIKEIFVGGLPIF